MINPIESIYPTIIIDEYPKKQNIVLFFVVKMNTNKDKIILKLSQDEVDKHIWVAEEDMR